MPAVIWTLTAPCHLRQQQPRLLMLFHHPLLLQPLLLLLLALLQHRLSLLLTACESVRQSAASPAAPWATSWPWSPAVACQRIRQCDNDSAATSRA